MIKRMKSKTTLLIQNPWRKKTVSREGKKKAWIHFRRMSNAPPLPTGLKCFNLQNKSNIKLQCITQKNWLTYVLGKKTRRSVFQRLPLPFTFYYVKPWSCVLQNLFVKRFYTRTFFKNKDLPSHLGSTNA